MTSSFIGNRLFVFNNYAPILQQFYKFWLLYFAIAVLHTVTLFLWSDIMNFNYKTGFLLATIMQFLLSYSGNKVLVFK
jgi:putative flippase GtrA